MCYIFCVIAYVLEFMVDNIKHYLIIITKMELKNIEENERNATPDKLFRISWQVNRKMNKLNDIYIYMVG